MGTFAYSAPEYLQTGRLTAKSDIWSYGVVLYELITGRTPIDYNRPKSEQRMLDWVKPYVADPRRFKLIIDPRIKDQCSVKSAYRLCLVANKCLARVPKTRPKMSEVLAKVQEIVNGMEVGDSPQPPLVSLGTNQEAVTDKSRRKGARLTKNNVEIVISKFASRGNSAESDPPRCGVRGSFGGQNTIKPSEI